MAACRPSQARRLDRADVRSSSSVAVTAATPPVPFGDRPSRSFGILSTFPPTACGIATFSAALAAGLVANGGAVDVVRCGATPALEDPLVMASLEDGTPDRLAAAVDVLDHTDVAIIQHEYGIYGGTDGEEVLAVMDALAVPTIVVAHTVAPTPTRHQRFVLERVCDAADAVVVMTESARARPDRRLRRRPLRRSTSSRTARRHRQQTRRPSGATNRAARLLTWGLLGPGKGIEWAIDAVARLADVRPRPTYLVAGATHPKVLAQRRRVVPARC